MKNQSKQGNRSILALAPDKTAVGPRSTPDLGPTFADRLRILKGAQSVNGFAKKCGVMENSMRQYLKGAKPRSDKLMKISAANDVSVDWLVGGNAQETARILLDHSAKLSAQVNARYEVRARDAASDIMRRLLAETDSGALSEWHILLVELLALGHIDETGARRILQQLKSTLKGE